MPAIVVDLDGTINNADHRVHLAQAQKWDEFHGKLTEDKVNEDVKFLLDRLCLDEDLLIIGCTGRNEAFRMPTMKWLRRKDILLDHLIMRPDGDWTPDHQMKPRLVEKFFGTREKVLRMVKFVLDDRDKVVEAWREYGLPCWQVRPGGY